MDREFKRKFWTVLILTLSLLGVDRLSDRLDRSPRFQRAVSKSVLWRVASIPGELHNTELTLHDLDVFTGNYYEGLHREPVQDANQALPDDLNFRDDFLSYEFKPFVNHAYPAGMRITNSLGMPNPEYGYQKPAHTRRIALLGDSISIGPYGHSYEQLLEGRLNQAHRTPGIQNFEVLNFAVYGYSILQTMEVARERVPKFQCDAYLLEMSILEVLGETGLRVHLAGLVTHGIDLKYPYLKDVIAQAGVKRTDSVALIRLKLTPFLTPITRWALEQIRDSARSHGAGMLIVLVPTPADTNVIAQQFDRLEPAIEGLGVPVIDLRDTFESVQFAPLRVSATDVHPNARGHEMIFENLYAKLRQNPQAFEALVGEDAASLPPF
jgi:hypothetical protein